MPGTSWVPPVASAASPAPTRCPGARTTRRRRRSSRGRLRGGAGGLRRGAECAPVCTSRYAPAAKKVRPSRRVRGQELCQSGGGRPRLPVPNKPDDVCGRKAPSKKKTEREAAKTRANTQKPKPPPPPPLPPPPHHPVPNAPPLPHLFSVLDN